MFERQGPRIFGLPPGVDFPKALVQGVLDRAEGMAPHKLARVEIWVNTRRMQRRLKQLFADGGARLLPRIRLITELGDLAMDAPLTTPVAPLQRRLELAQLVSHLLEQDPSLAPKSALYDLSESLAALMDEMQGEGVPPSALEALDISDESGHWERSLRFLRIVQRYFDDPDMPPDAEAWQRRLITHLAGTWANNPPDHPVIIAGSTGSRGTTALLMQAVARFPQGALVLPGFDFAMPSPVWSQLEDGMVGEDHPQDRFANLLAALELGPDQVLPWIKEIETVSPRNAFISLALRPAPVTDHWLSEGPGLQSLDTAVQGMTLVEADDQRAEAGAIALRLREAAEVGQTAALITPDRTLARRVSAALDRWRIAADDSAGTPLPLSAPGRLLLHLAEAADEQPPAERLLTILKHPLVNTGGDDRGQHLRFTRELELRLRRFGPPAPGPDDILHWAARDAAREEWARWLAHVLTPVSTQTGTLGGRLTRLIAQAEALCAGPGGSGSGTLWEDVAGRAAFDLIEDFKAAGQADWPLNARDFQSLLRGVLGRGEVREFDAPHPHILIWGTLEARVQGAELVILGGLNEGSWPEAAKADPWLNRNMRAEAGLLLPERRIGLAAHDFQQAVAAPEVWITRSLRTDDAETVPSRWVNRVVNLLGGLDRLNETDHLEAMRARGAHWLGMVPALDESESVSPEKRPSAAPPVAARPRRLTITEIKTLVRDPYAIYARHVLGLRPLDPLVKEPDAPLRGIVVHAAMERFIKQELASTSGDRIARLVEITAAVLEEEAPWPMAQRLWLARVRRMARRFLQDEDARRAKATPMAFEVDGEVSLAPTEFLLAGKADRIDQDANGALLLYDYKTGAPPTSRQQAIFDKQLLLSAEMAKRGAFKGVPAADVADAAYLGLADPPVTAPAPLGETDVWAEFHQLITQYLTETTGFTARRALERDTFGGDYDHLSRFGEWEMTDFPTKVIVT